MPTEAELKQYEELQQALKDNLKKQIDDMTISRVDFSDTGGDHESLTLNITGRIT
jgi:hypothetical protein